MDGGAWWAGVHGVAGSRTRLSDFPFTFHFHALEKEMATHSSVVCCSVPLRLRYPQRTGPVYSPLRSAVDTYQPELIAEERMYFTI